ncbi:nucleotidyltransferase family protein [Arenimonas sp. MALMAid1274]|uniref:nucleotidyltransferase family protein n=1 Tax=Arenimonas sp. MALMAid1274 TaxID=3411630 RepID=UPI003B9E7F04
MARSLDHASQQLLLLVARDRLSETQRSRARELARQVADWDAFVRVANGALGICLAHACLSRIDDAGIPSSVLERMRLGARAQATRSLLIEATYRHFMQQCLAPSGARHVFFKGPALAERYYDTPAHRPCRDLDVLVAPADVLGLVQRAMAEGYRPYELAAASSPRDIAAWVKYGSVFPMVSPSGVLVEIHQSFDHGDGFFDARAMLDRAETLPYRGSTMQVLSTADLFAYVCMHHTRHFWSHLHWFADLDAMSRHASFDLAQVRATAESMGMLATVDACLDLHRLAASGHWSPEPAPDSAEQALLAGALACLMGGRAREDELRATRLSSDRAFAWQMPTLQRWAYRARSLLRKARPTFSDYLAWPLPAPLQPLYYLTRPVRALAAPAHRGHARIRPVAGLVRPDREG